MRRPQAFHTQGLPARENKPWLKDEELEALRLADALGQEQEEAAR
jgi:predicted DNA-binding protein (UPF0251 family)